MEAGSADAPTPSPGGNPTATTESSRAMVSSPSDSNHQPPNKKVKNDPPASSAQSTFSISAPSHVVLPPAVLPSSTSVSAPSPAFVHSDHGTVPPSQQISGYQSYAPFSAPPSFAPGSAKGNGALFYKTKLCTKFKIGACTFNERCHFAHGTEDLRKPPPIWETAAGGTTGDDFASQTRIKTRPCRYFADGNCSYGDRCNFLHGNEELQTTPGFQGTYSATASQVLPSVAAGGSNYQMQGYSGGPSYLSNGSSVSSNAPYSNVNQGYTIPGTYADQNSAHSSYSASVPYSNYATVPVTPVASLQNVNAYANGQVMNPSYANSQDVSVNYSYWAGRGQPTTISQGYNQGNQVNQAASWMHNYSYVKRENGTIAPQYYQDQQPQVLSTASYVPQLGQSTGTDGGYYHGQYNQAANTDYASRYNIAESWGGK